MSNGKPTTPTRNADNDTDDQNTFCPFPGRNSSGEFVQYDDVPSASIQAMDFPVSGSHGARLSSFCFTIFPKDLAEYKSFMSWFKVGMGNPKWLIVARETCPTTKKAHLQGIIAFLLN
ncbi:hypothetical protein [Crucivirus-495]|nr:hypothetical protein [Crucivirus-495]